MTDETEMTRSERIADISRTISLMKEHRPDYMDEVEADHQSCGQTYLEYKIEMMDLMHGLGIKQYRD